MTPEETELAALRREVAALRRQVRSLLSVLEEARPHVRAPRVGPASSRSAMRALWSADFDALHQRIDALLNGERDPQEPTP